LLPDSSTTKRFPEASKAIPIGALKVAVVSAFPSTLEAVPVPAKVLTTPAGVICLILLL
jgi:hypothetical protein